MTGEPTPDAIDAHLHVWELDANTYPWITPDLGDLHADFPIERAETELRACGITGAVLVQAEDSLAETRYLLGIADRSDLVAGVVGWLPLEDPGEVQRLLDRRDPRLVGIRHLVHDDPRADLLDRDRVRSSLELVARAGLVLDVPDAWPRHLAQARRLAADLPHLTIVIDHLAKPPRGGEDFAAWRAELTRVAGTGTTVAKVSGLQLPGQPLTADALRPVWEIALELFGPGRLMLGSDWPLTVPHGGYRHVHGVLGELVGELAPAEQAALRVGTARRVYGLPADRP